ncbi:uncharacterized protein L969DRAFT_50088 [Mixia osmundae IAM 14324]|uniref:3-phytase n=1 Tax=Mixia osmundae (strain CBS 9802 / IAM 14324 / JCM 22182 / KY 12970) TaxID=764103 RepID=G7DYY1_MIXOS|nr:uncharacterized protein L969DRAFT_50088 [Mixia osmundae IAM 14324]KEI38623.1 hypothetical protein L969DRAFT_50088 [Mixia osmundae IAM 14324]GAA95791.1 hypothetical protein E5Q_02448 [Mixia osmundae IAM 14324]
MHTSDAVAVAPTSPAPAASATAAAPWALYASSANSVHGARYPTSAADERIRQALHKLQSATRYEGELAFLANYTYDLAVDDLTAFGVQQAKDLGALLARRYGHLNERTAPFVRASSSHRVVQAARHFSRRFTDSDSRHRPISPLLIIDESTSNDTLENSCPALNLSEARRATSRWLDRSLSHTAHRLAMRVPGVHLTSQDVVELISLCAFESVVSSEMPISPWCDVFSKSELASFAYYHDLNKHYSYSWPNTLGPPQGAGWVNELIARLTCTPVRDATQVNHTLFFPLDRAIYVDFTHDNQMIAIGSAIGLWQETLDPLNPNDTRRFKSSHIVPFGGHFIFERYRCAGTDQKSIRLLINDCIQRLDSADDGMIALSGWLAKQTFASRDARILYQQCFATPPLPKVTSNAFPTLQTNHEQQIPGTHL